MRTLKVLFLFALLALPVFSHAQVQQSSAIPTELTAAQREAREELNQAAADYREGRFAEAQQHSERALSLDPSNRTAPIFLARILHTQYKPGDSGPENVEKARAAIAAYQRILTYEPGNEEAYKAVAVLYAQIHEEQLLREWILQRALNPLVPADKRAEAYAVLAGKDWDCSFRITELPANKLVEMKRSTPVVVFRKPKDDLDFERAKQCVSSGLEMVETAIVLDPNSELAWSYKTNLLFESSKLAEMDGQDEVRALFLKQAKEASRQAGLLADKRRRESSDSSELETDRPLPPPKVEAEQVRDAVDTVQGRIIFGGDLDSVAVNKPTPPYPPIAKAAHASGFVKVEVVIDESGQVIRSHAVSGHPLLQAAAVAAARYARFSPTSIDGQSVKVRGFLSYEFKDQ